MKKINGKLANALAQEELEKNFFFMVHLEEQVKRIRKSDMTPIEKNGALQLVEFEIRDFLKEATSFVEPGDEIPF
jgi:hypothetical protein